MEPLSGVDTTWLRMETAVNPLTVTSIIWFREHLDYEVLREKVLRDLLPFRRFRQRVAGFHDPTARPRWEDDPEFDLDRHLHHLVLSDAGEQALRRELGTLMSRPLDFSRPLWEAYLVDEQGRAGGNALITRIHHSLADGFSSILLLAALIDEDCPIALPDGSSPPRLKPTARQQRPRRNRVALTRLLLRAAQPRMALRHTLRTSQLVLTGARLLAMRPDSRTSFHVALGPEKRVAWTRPIPLDRVKRRAKAAGATVNDLLLAALTGAFRRVLDERSEPTAGVEVRAIVPFNVRPFASRRDVFGNGFGLVFLDLPVGLATPEQRLAQVKLRMDAIKAAREALASFALLIGGGYLPEALLRKVLALFHGKSSAVVTNVPGPVAPVRLARVTVDDVVFFAPQSAGTGIGVSIFSYCGHVRLSVGADAKVLPDPLALVGAYHAELEALGIAPEAAQDVNPGPAHDVHTIIEAVGG